MRDLQTCGENACDNSSWYVIHTHPQQEDRAESNLRAWQVETYNPRLKDYRYNQYTRKQTYLSRPLFSRYIFARFDADRLLHKIWFSRGVRSVVSFGGRPATVSEEVILLLQSRTGDDGFVKIGEELHAGDRVVIEGGPFKSLNGIFEREVKASDRVMLLLTTVTYQAR